MIISYKLLSRYLPVEIDPQKLSRILTSIGLEVESLHPYESVKGGLEGMVAGEVLTCEKHPDADKLKITTVNLGSGDPVQIVCGASNVAAGQKVIVATIGSMLYPATGEPFQIKKAKIRGAESLGMICAEDEIGLGESHAGIMVLPAETVAGTAAAEIFEIYTDLIYEIGLTPNRMDAMSHLGVAKDVCAYLRHHDKKDLQVISPFKNDFSADHHQLSISVEVKNLTDCKRFSGVTISNITVADSPAWLQHILKSIGVRPINNIVDITNFILHETGQPLHAYDAAKISGQKIIVRNAAEGELFTTLDDKERKLFSADLVVADEKESMCMAGVFGGSKSGVTAATKNIFLESAWFSPGTVRRTSLQHGLRTDAATRFEKGVDISQTVHVLKHAATMIKEICGGEISSDIIDIYPVPAEKTSVILKYHYLKKLSGKNYHSDAIQNILTALGFEIAKDSMDELCVNVPFSKPDISLPADIVEEIMRIDGLDNIEIPATINISPGGDNDPGKQLLREKMAGYLVGNGFSEIFTNSITNSKYYDEAVQASAVKMINSLSADLDIMRPSMLQTGLEVIAYNANRKNTSLRFFETGKTYSLKGDNYFEEDHLALYITGNTAEAGWQQPARKADFYYLKGVCEKLLAAAGIKNAVVTAAEPDAETDYSVIISAKNKLIGKAGVVAQKILKQFGIKEPVFYADLSWSELAKAYSRLSITYKEVSKFPAVERDLALIVDKSVTYADIERTVNENKISSLKEMKLFDIFESEKLGTDKRSMAVNFIFADETKTMEDAETDRMMNKLISSLEKNLGAGIRK